MTRWISLSPLFCSVFLACSSGATQSASTIDSGATLETSTSNDAATDEARDVTTSADGSTTHARALGTVIDDGVIDCKTLPSGATLPAGSQCKMLEVACGDTGSLVAYVGISEPTTKVIGTLVTHSGGSGQSFLPGGPHLPRALAAGYRLVQIEWASEWEHVDGGIASLKSMACLPATVMKWAFDGPHGARRHAAFCGEGFSGGSAVMAYAMSTYGMKEYLDAVLFTEGPAVGRLDCGCDPSAADCAMPALCPEIPAPIDPLPADKVNAWEGIASCGTGSMSADDTAKLRADSPASDDGDFTYPRTVVSGWFCANDINAATGGGAYVLSKISPAPTIHCSTSCSKESIYDPAAKLGDGRVVNDAMYDEIITHCTPRHS